MQGKSAREKGARGEREFAGLLRQYGFEAERTGRNGRTAEDVTHSVRGVHFEVKRRNRFEPVAWLRQARECAGSACLAVAAWKRNNGEWIVLLGADEFLQFLADHEHLLNMVDVLKASLLEKERGPSPAPLSPPLDKDTSREEVPNA